MSAEIAEGASALIRPLLDDPGRSAVLTDIDGTLAPVVERPELAGVPDDARAILAELSGRFGLVGCISGRRATDARELVGLRGIAYAGNHGLELLGPGEEGPMLDPALGGREDTASEFLAGLDEDALSGLRVEDKGPIQALHWRGAEDEAAAERRAAEIAAAAEGAGLRPHRGRKVLEIRPAAGGGKDRAVSVLLRGKRLSAAIYGGDDRTDVDAFRRLRELRDDGSLDAAVCVAVASEEAPAELTEHADMTVEGPAGWLAVLRSLAG